jgi:hypothetical protein
MPGFDVCVPHEIGRKAAMARVQRYLEEVHQGYAHEVRDTHSEWQDNRLQFSFEARGLQIQGTLVVEDNAVSVSGPLQFAAWLFRAQIEETIEQELQKLLR